MLIGMTILALRVLTFPLSVYALTELGKPDSHTILADTHIYTSSEQYKTLTYVVGVSVGFFVRSFLAVFERFLRKHD